MQTPVMRARWTNLLLLTYEAPEGLLRQFIHPTLDLDRWNGRTHVSLVAFDFEDTRLFGVRIPGFTDFPEVNLRTYVRLGHHRGVVFIRELVPSRVIAAAARAWYNEPYRRVPLTSHVQNVDGSVLTDRRWRANGQIHQIRSSALPGADIPEPSTIEHHFKEQAWGFGRRRSGQLLRYRVDHPPWAVRQLAEVSTEVGFGRTYGAEWEFLDRAQPISTIFAEGSGVAVYPPERIQ
ncbi:MAG TPA: DUF2071 domain-containing protein [Gemmatimonadaceae bacterium]|nr:DUF2071 domain-containing protein [Gemmatimonadaceae bacterium]